MSLSESVCKKFSETEFWGAESSPPHSIEMEASVSEDGSFYVIEPESLGVCNTAWKISKENVELLSCRECETSEVKLFRVRVPVGVPALKLEKCAFGLQEVGLQTPESSLQRSSPVSIHLGENYHKFIEEALDRPKSWRNDFTYWAPPLAWGSWLSVQGHLGPGFFNISCGQAGNTAVMGQVKYWKFREFEVTETLVCPGTTNIVTADVGGNIYVRFKGIILGSRVDISVSPSGVIRD